jgi:hypothetical protein
MKKITNLYLYKHFIRYPITNIFMKNTSLLINFVYDTYNNKFLIKFTFLINY